MNPRPIDAANFTLSQRDSLTDADILLTGLQATARVVADHEHDSTVGTCAVQVGVTQHVARAVEPRRLAVPDTDDTVVLGERREVILLTSPHGGRGEILVQSVNVGDVETGLVHASQRLIETGER